MTAFLSAGCGSGLVNPSGCTKTSLTVHPTSARSVDQLFVSATLTDKHGEGVPGMEVDFHLTDKLGSGALPAGAGITDAQGTATVDLGTTYGKDPFLTDDINSARYVVVRYQADLFVPKGRSVPCSAKGHARFSYQGPKRYWPPTAMPTPARS